MIKFFRHIRQQLLTDNKFSKYLLYAIGEIILVVIGILIALQINTWNEKQKKQNLIKAYANSLISDLRDDINWVNFSKGQMEEAIVRIDSLANYVRTKHINEISNLALIPFMMGDYMYRPYSWNEATIEELKISGVLRYKGNEDLSKKIVSYDAVTKHLIEDFYSDLDQMKSISMLAGNIVNLNYSNFEELSFYGNINNSILEHDFSSSEAYRRAELENLKLLTGDINKIYEFLNGNLKLRSHLIIRTKYELPRLTRQAEDIIELLQTNYID